MSYFDSFLKGVDEGRAGYNLGLSTGLPRLDSMIGGVGKKTYTLIGSNLGVGKTAFVDHAYVLMPYLHSIQPDCKLKIRTFYYSFEIDRDSKIAKWVCYFIYLKYGLVLDIREVNSRKSILTDEKYKMIVEFRDFIEKMEERVHIYDRSLNPTGLYKDLEDYCKKNGKTLEAEKEIRGHKVITKTYVPNDKDEIVQYIEDHIGKARGEKELRTKKEIIDKGSDYAVDLRNTYGISKVAVSQFNREIGDLDRRKFAELTPQLEDFKDTGNPSEDANVIMSTFNPYRYNLPKYNGVDMTKLGGRYRNLVILKDRDGTDMKKLNLNFLGEVGHYREFPEPMFDGDYELAKEYKPWKK